MGDLYEVLDEWLGERFTEAAASRLKWLPHRRWEDFLDLYVENRSIDESCHRVVGNVPQVPKGELHVTVPRGRGADVEYQICRNLASAHGVLLPAYLVESIDNYLAGGSDRMWPELQFLARLRPLHELGALTLVEGNPELRRLDPPDLSPMELMLLRDVSSVFEIVGFHTASGKIRGFTDLPQTQRFEWMFGAGAESLSAVVQQLRPAALAGGVIHLSNALEVQALGIWLHLAVSVMHTGDEASILRQREIEALTKIIQATPVMRAETPRLRTVLDLPQAHGSPSLNEVVTLRRERTEFHEYLNLLKDVLNSIAPSIEDEEWLDRASLEARERIAPAITRLRKEVDSVSAIIRGAGSGLLLSIVGSAAGAPIGGSPPSEIAAAAASGLAGAGVELARTRGNRKLAGAKIRHLEHFVRL